jgi:DNA-3-methyladenine glycosylase II
MAKAPPPALHRILRLLSRRCPHVRRALTEVGLPEPRALKPGFATLVRIIIDQQVSVAAGAAIWRRLVAACGGRVTPARLLSLGEAELRGCGFSGQKARYALGIAAAVTAKQLNFRRLHAAEDEAVLTSLTALKGIGTWTAEIYMLFAMQRPDVWPVGDPALQHGVRALLGLQDRPAPRDMITIAESWRPYRSSVAVLLWHYYTRTQRQRAPA